PVRLRDETEKKKRFALPIGQSGKNRSVFTPRLETYGRFGIYRGPFREELIHAQVIGKALAAGIIEHQDKKPRPVARELFFRYLHEGEDAADIIVGARIDVVLQAVALPVLARFEERLTRARENFRFHFECETVDKDFQTHACL